ncbi:NAD-dependent protein deacylase sirtuin-5A, mitochondrial-like [Bacillus rossius redtenbacheri]|uniref:NAD-dependent protein deacylase sirtuin-5A, mitochondrial-like n=1 Tax=Bacillus rossius redtenbacheri TaxID=93214 RepID=UPI002FDD77D9
MTIVNLIVRGKKQYLRPVSQICNYISGAMSSRRPISDKAAFKDVLKNAKKVAVLTGAGVSAESGVPTFRGEGGYWRKYVAQQLATPEAFTRNPSLVWEFYHYRRELVRTKKPNKAHVALAECEKRFHVEGKSFVLVTQNIDGLHQTAGSREVVELHGSLFKTRCLKCGDVAENRNSPICPALDGMGAPDTDAQEVSVATEDLPRCERGGCTGLLRPHVVWFGEALDVGVLQRAGKALEECDLCLVIGTSSLVYPAAMFAPQVAARGVPVAEFNIEVTPATSEFTFHFEGPCGSSVPEVLAP